MININNIQEFFNQKTLAVIGVSRSPKKFPFQLYKALKNKKDYQVFAINPYADDINGEPCYASITSLPTQVTGVVIVTPPNQTEKIVKDAAAAGIKHIWIQQGAESQAAIEYCEKAGINVIHHECVLMFAEPITFPHNVHRGIWRLLGKLPK